MGFVASGHYHVHRGGKHRSICELNRWSREVVVQCSANEFRERFESQIRSLQDEVCSEVVKLDGGAEFHEDVWAKENGQGGGRSRVIEDGNMFEKAAVNLSIVNGDISPERAAAMRSRGRKGVSDGSKYFAGAISIVFHARSPLVPTLRGDIRVFQSFSDSETVTWGGGGADLTPSYFFEEDTVEFHRFWKQTCDRYDPSYYAKFKKWCDEYFYIPMRKEHRGVGGIFFDDLEFETEAGLSRVEEFLHDVARGWLPSYTAIAERRKESAYGEKEREWQLLRRGRYAEFNLVYDRGVRFGLLSNGRIESIMVSAPPLVRWKYNHVPDPGSKEEEMLEILRTPRDWV
ncbi:hypothetical protein NDN08_000070 [Rhodosorus marinus]|uniref:Coproporphyrinogen oxidase n=1 Tax=Rhodosorus marinus TaxID=101924 RepID=A0AAV8UE43_9RHOD|nr:hypothetical protein NDN08_000070 [Rhodosorus marinus]